MWHRDLRCLIGMQVPSAMLPSRHVWRRATPGKRKIEGKKKRKEKKRERTVKFIQWNLNSEKRKKKHHPLSHYTLNLKNLIYRRDKPKWGALSLWSLLFWLLPHHHPLFSHHSNWLPKFLISITSPPVFQEIVFRTPNINQYFDIDPLPKI